MANFLKKRGFKRPADGEGGFTFLEMLVSLAIFSVVAIIAVGSLVRITGLNRKAQSIQSAMNSVSFALETMSRDMRVGSKFQCQSGGVDSSWTWSGSSLTRTACVLTNNGTAVLFQSAETAPNGLNLPCRLIYAYRFIPSSVTGEWKLQKAQQSACGGPLGAFSDMLDPTTVHLSGFSFSVNSASYAWITVDLSGYGGDSSRVSEQTPFDIQTGISERIADF